MALRVAIPSQYLDTRLSTRCLDAVGVRMFASVHGLASLFSLAKYPLNENMCVFARECTGAASGGRWHRHVSPVRPAS